MIVPMKKLVLYAFQADRENILSALQSQSLVMITGNRQASAEEQMKSQANALQEITAALSLLHPYQPKAGMFQSKPKLSYSTLLSQDHEGNILTDKVLSIQESIRSKDVLLASLDAENASLAPWRGLDIPLNTIRDTRCVKLYTGFFPNRSLDALHTIENLGSDIVILGENFTGTAALLVTHRDWEDAVLEKAKALGFLEVQLPDEAAPAALIYQRNEEKAALLRTEIDELHSQLEQLGAKTEKLQQLYDREATKLAVSRAVYETTDTMIVIEGWLRSDRQEHLERTLKSATEYYTYELLDPADDEKPPTVTQNSSFISQFEVITDMFSSPNPRDVLDPNTVMGIWYWIIFGMMMGDVGYGLMMVILIGSYKLLTKKASKLMNVLFYSGFTSIFWGIMFGSYFGESLFPPVIAAPLNNIMLMMGICLGMGVLHIFSGMILKMYIDWKEGHPWDGVFDQLSSMLLVIGLILLAVSPSLGRIIALVGAGTILLMAGREKKNLFARLGGGIMGVYNTLTGLFSDILSYCRILALMLSSGIVAMVMNILAGMVMPSPGSSVVGIVVGGFFGIAIYIVGHAFNLALSLLSAYVHDSRLQYLEFFGKFYDGGGYAFRPLAPNTKFTEIENIDQTA